MRAPFVLVVALVGCASPAPPSPAPAPRAAPTATPIASAPAPAPVPPPDGDLDGDKIADSIDKCPTEPETYNGIEDEDGCPDHATVMITTSNPPAIIDRVTFEKGSTKVLPSATAILEEVAAVMKAHPEVELVQLEGHADPAEKKPVELATKRAEAIRASIVADGIDAARLRARGFGAHCLAAAGETRRVEFKVVTMNGKPGTGTFGCDAATKAGISPLP